MDLTFSRLTILAGHYGSGKTHLAVNLALWLRRRHDRVVVADLDIVNPYYRTKDAEALLKEADIRLISSPLAGTNLDAPAMSAAAETIFDTPGLYAVADVGGDDRGALALGRYSSKIKAHDSCQVLFVFNCCRPLTATVGDALSILREIEAAGKVSFTGLINNSNIGPDTTPQDIFSSRPIVEELSVQSGLPIVMTSVRRDLAPLMENEPTPVFPVDILQKPNWVL